MKKKKISTHIKHKIIHNPQSTVFQKDSGINVKNRS